MKLNPYNPQPGTYHDVPESEYRKASGICQTDLKEALISLKHYKHRIDSPPEPPSDDMVNGTLIHSLVLLGRKDYVVIPEVAPKKPTKAQIGAKKPSEDTLYAVKWWESFCAENAGKELVDGERAKIIEGTASAIELDRNASRILESKGDNEVAAFKIHERTGLLLRGRADRVCVDKLGRVVIPDIKTVRFGFTSRDAFSREILNRGYHIQAAFYTDLFDADFFMFIVAEKEPPFDVAVHSLGPRSIELGRRKYEELLTKVAECQKTGVWPGASPEITEIDLQEWALKKEQL